MEQAGPLRPNVVVVPSETAMPCWAQRGVRQSPHVLSDFMDRAELAARVKHRMLGPAVQTPEDRVLEAMRSHPGALWSVAGLVRVTGLTREKVEYAVEARRSEVRLSRIPTRRGMELYAPVEEPVSRRERWMRIRALIAKQPY